MYISRYLKSNTRTQPVTPFGICSIEFLQRQTPANGFFNVQRTDFVMIWIQEGWGKIAIDLAQYDIEENTICFIKPGQAFHASINEPAKGFVMTFAKDFLDLGHRRACELSQSPLLNHMYPVPVIMIDEDMGQCLNHIAYHLQDEFENYFKLRNELLKGFLNVFLIYLERRCELEVGPASQSRKIELTQIFFSLLEKHFATKKLVRDYAQMLSVSRSYLNETVKEISGCPASYHIQQRIVLEAKRQAIYEGDSMKEIAYRLGFCDPAHFSKFFKNSSGTNFTDFRKKGISY